MFDEHIMLCLGIEVAILVLGINKIFQIIKICKTKLIDKGDRVTS